MHFNFKLDQSTLNLDYSEAEETFIRLIHMDDLDNVVRLNPSLLVNFEETVNCALINAYRNDETCSRAHLFLQRILYYINRLKLFWFDDLNNYANETSACIFAIRLKIETEWATWEKSHVEARSPDRLVIDQILMKMVEEDLNVLPSKEGLFLRNEISLAGYQRLLAITSLDGLVEASQLSRVLGGVGNETQLTLLKILWEEYGSGKLARKHSSHFIQMLKTLDMDTRPEAYFDLVPWEVLTNINHSFLLSERKQYYLRYIGGLLYIEVSAPSAFQNYKYAGERLGLGEEGTSYWDIHIKEDIRHGQWMLQDVTLPLLKQYEDQAWQILLGYNQQKFISVRAVKAIVESIRELEI